MSNPLKKIRILFVDDEINNLHAFKAAFRFDYDITVAQSASEAETWLEQNEVDLILCDQRMPGKTGVEFFSSILKKHPKPIRILVTGYTDIESVIKAINLGHVFRYINKPWNEAEIRSSIEEAYRYYTQSHQLESKVTELTRAYNALDGFAYSVSHDLKGPLMSIMGAINIVNNSPDKNQKNVSLMLELIEKAAVHLNEFIENMHVYYRNNRGELKIEPVNLEDLKSELLSIHGITCHQQNISLTINCENTTEFFRTDVTKLKVVINNLVSNALKYQRAGEVNKYVDVEMRVIDENLIIHVKDNGMGIPDEYLQNIFELFFRATTEVSGSGFGLYNVKEIVTTLGGKINVESKLNSGSTFTVNLPCK